MGSIEKWINVGYTQKNDLRYGAGNVLEQEEAIKGYEGHTKRTQKPV